MLFCLFSANGYQLMSDEQLVSSYLHFPGIFYCSCNCMCWVACTVLLSSDTTETNDCLCAYVVDAPVLASYNLQRVSYQCPPPHTQLLSALLYAQSMLSVACVLAVNFEVYTLSNSNTVFDECCVLAYIRTRISDD